MLRKGIEVALLVLALMAPAFGGMIFPDETVYDYGDEMIVGFSYLPDFTGQIGVEHYFYDPDLETPQMLPPVTYDVVDGEVFALTGHHYPSLSPSDLSPGAYEYLVRIWDPATGALLDHERRYFNVVGTLPPGIGMEIVVSSGTDSVVLLKDDPVSVLTYEEGVTSLDLLLTPLDPGGELDEMAVDIGGAAVPLVFDGGDYRGSFLSPSEGLYSITVNTREAGYRDFYGLFTIILVEQPVTNHCTNGKKDGDEDWIDCGGGCIPCPSCNYDDFCNPPETPEGCIDCIGRASYQPAGAVPSLEFNLFAVLCLLSTVFLVGSRFKK